MRKFVYLALLVSLGVAAFLSPIASRNPDGLERVALDKGFIHLSQGQEVISSPLSHYLIPGVGNGILSGSLAGVIGTLLVFALMYGVGRLFLRRSRRVDDRGQE